MSPVLSAPVLIEGAPLVCGACLGLDSDCGACEGRGYPACVQCGDPAVEECSGEKLCARCVVESLALRLGRMAEAVDVRALANQWGHMLEELGRVEAIAADIRARFTEEGA